MIRRETEFAKRVIACREKLGLRQNACARLVDVTRQQYNNWEAGRCKPKGQIMAQLAAVLKCDVVWLQHGDETELEQRIDRVMTAMRVIVRDLEHIHRALGSARVKEKENSVRVEDEDEPKSSLMMEAIYE